MIAIAADAVRSRLPVLTGRIAGEGAILMTAFGGAQAASFLRNALIGHWLSKGDFGIAASLALTLQMLEMLSDLAVDRLIVQDADGDRDAVQSTAHALLVARGIALALALAIIGPALAAFYRVPDAALAFQALALVPLAKGFMHLDMRRYQRRLHNRAFAAVELAPQLAALAATVPFVVLVTDYTTVVWIAGLQAILTVAVSHLVAERPYRLAIDRPVLDRALAFGWPIWLSAIPLLAVFQLDRIIIARLVGIEALAAYTAAFMLTMVPSLIAAKVGQALMLPLLAEARDDPDRFASLVARMTKVTRRVAIAYVLGFLALGGPLVEITFGPAYHGLGPLAAALAAMWAVRMLQAPAGMALMALGDTRPLLMAGLVRACALLPAFALAWFTGHLVAIALAGLLGEMLSFAYVQRTLIHRRPSAAGAAE